MSYALQGGRLLTTMLLLWEVPYRHYLEILTFTNKLLGQICSMGKVFTIFELELYMGGHVTRTEKKASTQTAYSFGHSKQCTYLRAIKMQNVMNRLLEIRITMEVMTS